MPVTNLLIESLQLMAIGMGLVVAFLLLLVGVLRVIAVAVARFAPPPPLVALSHGSYAEDTDDGELVAVISAAIARYRKERPSGRE
jgi:oxaloacetate decarboxylase gamma subunit